MYRRPCLLDLRAVADGASFVCRRIRLRRLVVRQIFRSCRFNAFEGLLRKTYIDYCHLAVSTHNLRPEVAALFGIQGIGVPLVMLTTTAPV